MKLTVSRRVLHLALTAVTRVVEGRQTVPILANVALEAAGGDLILRATNLDLEARQRIDATVAEPGALTVPANRLRDIVGKLPDGPVEIATLGDNATVRVRAGRARFDLLMLPISDFPDMAADDLAIGFNIAGDLLAEAIDAVTFAISTEETRYYLNGVYLHALEGRLGASLVAVATDGHRLARWSRAAPAGAEALPGIIVPRKMAAELGRALKDHADPVRVEASDSKLRVTAGDFRLTSRLIDGTFPDYQRVIPAESDTLVTLTRADLVATVERVGTIAADRSRGIKCTFVAGERLTVSMLNPDAGSAEEEIAYDGATEIEIGFNGRYLADALNSLTGDRVEIGLTDPGSPTTFRPAAPPAGTAERTIVLMPMRFEQWPWMNNFSG